MKEGRRKVGMYVLERSSVLYNDDRCFFRVRFCSTDAVLLSTSVIINVMKCWFCCFMRSRYG